MTDPHITCLRTEADRQATTYGRYTAVLDENERLKRELAAAQKEIAALRELLREAADTLHREASTHGHGHWDEKMTYGANCPLCIAQRQAGGWDMAIRIEAALDAAKEKS